MICFWVYQMLFLLPLSLGLNLLNKINSDHLSYPRLVIVGAGPSGLVSALTFQQLGWKDIIILEKRSQDSIETARSYTYLIDGRGQQILNLLNLTHLLPSYGVPFTNITEFIEVTTRGEIRERKINVIGIPKIDRYFIARSVFLELLTNEIKRKNALPRQNENDLGKIQVFYNCSLANIQKRQDGSILLTCNQDISNTGAISQELTFAADILFGCDGINSKCRQFLANQSRSEEVVVLPDVTSSWPTIFPRKKLHKTFQTIEMHSDSAGLNYKFLSLQSSVDALKIKDLKSKLVNGSHPIQYHKFSGEKMFIIRGKHSSISLNFFPIRSIFNQRRAAGIIRPPSDPIWKLAPASIPSYLHELFPQLDWEDFINDKELVEQFSSPPGRFPKPQFSLGMQLPLFGDGHGANQYVPGSFVALLGDAAHSFPPDLGQGVNSALQDIYVLREKVLQNPHNLQKAFEEYEQTQQPESQAIATLCTFAYPYQYNQSRWKKFVFIIKYFGRTLQSKLFPRFFSEPAFTQVLKYTVERKYSEILINNHKSNQRTWFVVIVSLFAFLLSKQSHFRSSFLLPLVTKVRSLFH